LHPSAAVIDHAFGLTVDYDRLRNLLTDLFIYSEDIRWRGDFPNAFLILVLTRMEYEKTSKHLRIVEANGDWTRRNYYQHIAGDPDDSD
jgi:hypothetical protein